MAKYEIEMEFTGFRLKVRGEREDIPVITANLQEQMTGLLAPAVNIARGELPATNGSAVVLEQPSTERSSKPKRSNRVRRAAGGNGEPSSPTIEFDHDPAKWGVPRQAWQAGQKILWLLHVVAEGGKAGELSVGSIVSTFNKHFRQAGLLKTGSMTKVLANLKQKAPALISDHADKSPITWFLTEEGQKEAAKLVSQARGEASPQG